MPRRIAEGDDPGIVGHEEIEHRGKEDRIARAPGKVADTGARGCKERRQHVVVARQPAERLNRERLGSFPLSGHLASGYVGRPGFRKGFLNQSVGRLKAIDEQLQWALRIMAGRILIVDDVATNRIVMKVKLAEARYEAQVAASASACLRAVREALPDLILLDRALPDMDGVELVRLLKRDPVSRDIPIILTHSDADPKLVMQGLRAGADDVMAKPMDDLHLMARLRAMLRAREGAEELQARDATLGLIGMAEAAAPFDLGGTVALIADRPERAMQMRGAVGQHLMARLVIQSRDDALGRDGAAGDGPVDLFVIDADVGGTGGGLRLLSDLRSRSGSRHSAVCMVLPCASAAPAAMAFDLGADDVVPEDADPQETALRLSRLLRRKHLDDRLRATVSDGLRLAVIDPLTGLHNRRFAMARLGRLIDHAHRTGSGLAVMLIDLDRFKAVNDRHGHAAGDAVLVEIAQRLTANLREGDLLARIGGEELLVALPDSTLAEAERIAARLCEAVEERAIPVGSGRGLTVTVSIGLAVAVMVAGRSPEDVARLVERADLALLQSKSRGRNRITISRTAA